MRLVVLLVFIFYGLGFYPLTRLLSNSQSHSIAIDSIPNAARKLVISYPDFISHFADNRLYFKDNTQMIWDDGITNKSLPARLQSPDLKDMFNQHYTTGKLVSAPERNFDPGRVRNDLFFQKIYGRTEAEVSRNFTTITWCPKLVGQKIRVTRVNGIDKKLEEISNELDQHPELKKYLTNIGGTFTWRNIAGTTRHSMHSYGMTIDINTQYSDYWQWACKCTDENAMVSYKNRIPQLIVDIFEKHGFIWGGKWYHYDTMHFEYRPELIN